MVNKMESISARLQRAMSIRNLKQIDLVEKTQIPKASISQYISGYAEPKSDRIYLLAKALDVNPVWLAGFDVPMDDIVQIERYNADTAEFLVKINNTPELIKLNEAYLKLDAKQRESIMTIIEGMAPKGTRIGARERAEQKRKDMEERYSLYKVQNGKVKTPDFNPDAEYFELPDLL